MLSRRDLLGQAGFSLAAIALTDLMSRAAGPPMKAGLHHEAKAKRCVFLFMNGAPSQVDTFDPKPALDKHDGKAYKGGTPVGSNGRPIGHLMRSPFPFKKHGKSGLPISSLFPHTAAHADDLCVLRGMYTDTAAHASGCIQMNTGAVQIGKPALGAWLSYGLGSLADDLPSFVVMSDPRGGPIGSASNWSAGFLPAKYQGTLFRGSGSPLLDLETPKGVSEKTQRDGLDLLGKLNEAHLKERPGDSELAARIASYELAYRMQKSALAAVSLDRESEKTKAMYGVNERRTADFGRKCLITRRLLERGVRFVQLYSGGGHLEDTWDGHSDCIANHTLHAGETDKPIAALLADLKRTGLWKDTLVIWGGEFGRTPTSEGVGKKGRDHNPFGFSMWLAGAGVKGGHALGETDEFGFRAVKGKAHVSDLHATVLHLMGIDHEKLTFKFQGGDQRLTGVRGNVVEDALA
jgi:hypothetical protein